MPAGRYRPELPPGEASETRTTAPYPLGKDTAVTVRPDRIRTEHHVTAMVALDTIDLITERIRTLFSYGRRVTLVRRFTYLDKPPEVFAGRTLDGEIDTWTQPAMAGAGIHVRLSPGLMVGFGFAAYARDGAATEAALWRRYHADPDDRHDMTEVALTGGLAGHGPGRADQILLHHWNRDRVCEQIVVAFDPGEDSDPQRPTVEEVMAAIDAYRAAGDPAGVSATREQVRGLLHQFRAEDHLARP